MRLLAMCASTMPGRGEREPAPRRRRVAEHRQQPGERGRDERHRQHAGAGQVQPLRHGIEPARRRVRRGEHVLPVAQTTATLVTRIGRPPLQHPSWAQRRSRPAGAHARRLRRVSRRSSCACPPCAGPACPRPSGTRRSTISPRNSVWFADLDRLADLALDVRDRLREHGRAGDRTVEVREAVERARARGRPRPAS